MWWIIKVTSSPFPEHVEIFPLVLFRVLFAMTCCVKFAIETYRGYWSHFNANKYLSVRFQFSSSPLFISRRIYKIAYISKILAAPALLLGIYPRCACAILIASFLVELHVFFKFHTCFFLLLTISLIFSPDLSSCLTFKTLMSGMDMHQALRQELATKGELLPYALVGITVLSLYLFSAYRKLSSPQFMRGLTVRFTVAHLQCQQHDYGWNDMFFVTLLPSAERIPKEYWLSLSWSVVLLELILPILLVLPDTVLIGAITGIFMHVFFTALSPVTLCHFSLATISTYLVFFEPKLVTHAIETVLL